MSRTNTTPTATVPPAGPTIPVAQRQFEQHACCSDRDLRWHHELGRLVLACCPPGTRGRTRRLKALAAGNPGCSLSLLYKVIKFSNQYTAAEVDDLVCAGPGWDRLAILLSIPRPARDAAVSEVTRLGLTSREVRRWKDERHGQRATQGRVPCPLPDHSPAVQAHALAIECRALCARHHYTHDVFERVLQSLERGRPPPPRALARMRSAVEAVGSIAERAGPLHALLQRIVAACEEGRAATGTRRCGRRQGANAQVDESSRPRA